MNQTRSILNKKLGWRATLVIVIFILIGGRILLALASNEPPPTATGNSIPPPHNYAASPNAPLSPNFTPAPDPAPVASPAPDAIQANLPIIRAKIAAEHWLKANLRDPDSLEIVKSEPLGGDEHSILMGVEYRAKNGFGGMNVEMKLFIVKDGKVTEVNDFNPEAAAAAVQALDNIKQTEANH